MGGRVFAMLINAKTFWVLDALYELKLFIGRIHFKNLSCKNLSIFFIYRVKDNFFLKNNRHNLRSILNNLEKRVTWIFKCSRKLLLSQILRVTSYIESYIMVDLRVPSKFLWKNATDENEIKVVYFIHQKVLRGIFSIKFNKHYRWS